MNPKLERNTTSPLMEKIDKRREQVYAPLRKTLDSAEVIFTSSQPDAWWRRSYRLLRKTERDFSLYPNEFPVEMHDFFSSYGSGINNILKSELQQFPLEHTSHEEQNIYRSERAKDVMHEISDYLMEDEPIAENPMQVKTCPMHEIIKKSDSFKLIESEKGHVMQIYSKKRNTWYNFPLPQTDNVMHKGGFPRVVLKILSGAKQNLIESELPPNDFDVIALNEPAAIKDTLQMGIDPDGIEAVKEFDLPLLMNNRDLDLNGCFMSKNGLIYSSQAQKAASTGKIEIVATKRGIYGTEIFFHEGTRLIKNRGMMRLLKTTTEGKADSFNFLPVNEQVDLSIYWIILAKRLGTKQNGAELLDKLFYLGKQIKQVHANEEDIYDVLDRVHAQYPFFNFDGIPLDKIGLARWLQKKFIKQIDKKYRDRYSIPSGIQIERKKNDTRPYTVSLANYSISEEKLAEIASKWDQFIARCRRRTIASLESVEDSDIQDF